MESLPPGWRFEPSDQELVEYLHHHDLGHTRFSFGAINEAVDPYSRRPDQLPRVSANGASSYYYADCFYKMISGRVVRNRHTLDGAGYWKSTDGKKPIHIEGQIVGYKQALRFYGEGHISTKSVMMEYTLHQNRSHDTPKAICAIRRTAGN